MMLLGGMFFAMQAQLVRESVGEYMSTAPLGKVSGNIELPRAAQGKARPASGLKAKTRRAPAPVVAKAAPKGSFEGLKTYSSLDAGWYRFNGTTNPKKIWLGNFSHSVQAAFTDGEVLYAFWHSVTSGSNALNALGLDTYSLATGAKLSSEEYDVFEQTDRLVYAAAYNADEACAYLICAQKGNASRYSLQRFNPATGTFAEVALLPASTLYPMAFAWHPRNGGLYMISEYGALERFNASTGSFRKVADTSLALDDEYGYAGAMVYSPKDEAFVVLIQTDTYTSFYTVNPLTAATATLYSLNDDSQWRLLVCTDATADATAPGALGSVTATFPAGALSGSLSVVLPTQTVDGNALAGDVYVRVTEGQQVLSESVKGAPGATVTVPLTLTAGAHTLGVAAMTRGTADLVGPKTTVAVFAGNDTPGAPGDVTLSTTGISWSVPAGVSGGYVDPATLLYNVYVDGELLDGCPVAGTSLNVPLPDHGPVAHIAEVEAVAGDYVTPRGMSNIVVGTQPFGLPCSIAPVAGMTNLTDEVRALFSSLDVNGDGRQWIYDEQKEQTGGFYYLCHSTNQADDWLVLPSMTFPRAGSYRLSMEMSAGYNGYFADSETFEIGIGAEPFAPSMSVISEQTTLQPKKQFEPYELIFKVETPGTYHLGIHCVTEANHYRLYARRFLVEALAGAAAPAAVSDLSAAAAAEGRLEASVAFTMPLNDVENQPLAADAPLTATVSCGTASVNVDGLPGATVSATIAVEQGDNTIEVRVCGADGVYGPVASVPVEAGVDIPGVVTLSKVISADNLTLTLKWTLPNVGINGGYVDPATCTYIIYRHNGDSYIEYARTAAGATEWQFSVDAAAEQDVYAFGVMPENVAGSCGSFAVTDVVLGKLYTLPMNESYRSVGENVMCNYNPIAIQNVADQYCSWTFVDPSELEGGYANDTHTALVAYYQGVGQVSMPRFSTVGADNVRISVSMMHGAAAPGEVVLAVVTPDDGFVPVETVDLTEGTGWQTTTFTIPEGCLGKGWAALALRNINSSYKQYFCVDGYTIEAYTGTGLNVVGVATPGKVRVGRSATITATLANYSAQTQTLPALSATFTAENGTVATLEAADGFSEIVLGRGEKAQVEFTLRADVDHLGYGKVTIAIADPAKVDQIGSADARINVVKGYTPYVADLRATLGDGVELSWSPLELKASVVEGFEDFDPWCRDDMLGDFQNLDYDGSNTYYISGATYPGKYEPKAFQVFAGSEFAVEKLQAYAGDQYIAVFSPDSHAVLPGNDWLISPRVVGGSRVAMMMLAPSNEFGEETIELLYSTTHDDTSAFEVLATYTTKDMQWQSIEATLPADARYFALHYTGFDRFMLMIDNLEFSPYESDGTVESYTVLANGVAIATTPEPRYTVADPVEGAVYRVVPSIRHNDGTVEPGVPSNSAIAGVSGLTVGAACGTVSGARGAVLVKGFAGMEARVVAVDGRTVAAVDQLGSSTAIPVQAGVYLVTVGQKTFKVIVR